MNIYIIRHCKAVGQSPEANLTDEGYKQAERLAEFLYDKNIECIISSPFERSLQSMFPLANKLGITVKADVRLSERILCCENRPNWREMLRNTFHDLDLCYLGGESSREAMERAVLVVRDIRNSGQKNVILATHGNLMTLLLMYYDNNQFGFEQWEVLSNPDVYHLMFDGDGDSPIIRRVWMD